MVDDVSHRVNDAEEADAPADHLVEIDVPVKGQEPVEASRAQPRDAPAQREQQHESAVKVETLTFQRDGE